MPLNTMQGVYIILLACAYVHAAAADASCKQDEMKIGDLCHKIGHMLDTTTHVDACVDGNPIVVCKDVNNIPECVVKCIDDVLVLIDGEYVPVKMEDTAMVVHKVEYAFGIDDRTPPGLTHGENNEALDCDFGNLGKHIRLGAAYTMTYTRHIDGATQDDAVEVDIQASCQHKDTPAHIKTFVSKNVKKGDDCGTGGHVNEVTDCIMDETDYDKIPAGGSIVFSIIPKRNGGVKKDKDTGFVMFTHLSGPNGDEGELNKFTMQCVIGKDTDNIRHTDGVVRKLSPGHSTILDNMGGVIIPGTPEKERVTRCVFIAVDDVGGKSSFVFTEYNTRNVKNHDLALLGDPGEAHTEKFIPTTLRFQTCEGKTTSEEDWLIDKDAVIRYEDMMGDFGKSCQEKHLRHLCQNKGVESLITEVDSVATIFRAVSGNHRCVSELKVTGSGDHMTVEAIFPTLQYVRGELQTWNFMDADDEVSQHFLEHARLVAGDEKHSGDVYYPTAKSHNKLVYKKVSKNTHAVFCQQYGTCYYTGRPMTSSMKTAVSNKAGASSQIPAEDVHTVIVRKMTTIDIMHITNGVVLGLIFLAEMTIQLVKPFKYLIRKGKTPSTNI